MAVLVTRSSSGSLLLENSDGNDEDALTLAIMLYATSKDEAEKPELWKTITRLTRKMDRATFEQSRLAVEDLVLKLADLREPDKKT